MADQIPKDWEDAIIMPVFKKGSRKNCGSYRGISRLSAKKILARSHTPQNIERTNNSQYLAWDSMWYSQWQRHCGYSWILSILCLPQLEEKCKEHNIPLYAVLTTSQWLLIPCSESIDVLLLIYQSFEGTAQRNASTCGSRKLHLQEICPRQWWKARLRAPSDTVLSLPISNNARSSLWRCWGRYLHPDSFWYWPVNLALFREKTRTT